MGVGGTGSSGRGRMREWEEKEGVSSARSPPSCSGDGFATLGAMQ